MAGDVQVVDAVGTRDHAGHDAGHLAARVGSLVAGHVHLGRDQAVQVIGLGQAHHRFQTGTRHQIRIIKRCARNRYTMA